MYMEGIWRGSMRNGMRGFWLCEKIKKGRLSTDKLKEAVSKVTTYF